MTYYVDLLASKKHGTLYLGVTNDIVRRGYEHRTKAAGGFTAIRGRKAGLVRNLRRRANRYCSRKRTEKMAARLEDTFDRRTKSGVGRSISRHLKLRQGLWIPGPRQKGASRNDVNSGAGLPRAIRKAKTPALLPGFAF
jgi:predicted GIY-YIG superfamily endonuclease